MAQRHVGVVHAYVFSSGSSKLVLVRLYFTSRGLSSDLFVSGACLMAMPCAILSSSGGNQPPPPPCSWIASKRYTIKNYAVVSQNKENKNENPIDDFGLR